MGPSVKEPCMKPKEKLCAPQELTVIQTTPTCKQSWQLFSSQLVNTPTTGVVAGVMQTLRGIQSTTKSWVRRSPMPLWVMTASGGDPLQQGPMSLSTLTPTLAPSNGARTKLSLCETLLLFLHDVPFGVSAYPFAENTF